MLGNLLNNLKCPACEEGDLEFSHGETFEAYDTLFDLEDIDTIVDGVINQFLVFRCMKCQMTQRLTYRMVEEMVRKDISKKVMTMKAIDNTRANLSKKIRYYVYCGCCPGFDGRGSCPPDIYYKCELRKIPNVL